MSFDKSKVSWIGFKRNYGRYFDGFALSDKNGRIFGADMPEGTTANTPLREVLLFMENCPFAVCVNRRAGSFLDAILLDPAMQSGIAICLDRQEGVFLFLNSMRENSADHKLIEQIEKLNRDKILGNLLNQNGEKK